MTHPGHDRDRTAMRVAKMSGTFALVAAALGAMITGVFGLLHPDDKTPAAGAVPGPTVTAGPTTAPSTTPPPPSPSAVTYGTVYADKQISTPVSGFSSFVDLDAPKAGAEMEDAEFWWNGARQLRSDLRWATAAGAEVSPANCIDAVDADPLPNFVPARAGLTVCLLLDPSWKTATSAKSRVFRITITEVSADRTVYRITAWERSA